jgi:hypothetical protein
MIFVRILGLCLLILLILWIASSTTTTTKESMVSSGGTGTGSYLLSKSSIEESPQEVKEHIYTVDSAGEHSSTEYDIKYHSKEKINCISPAVYNEHTFACDCSAGSEYNDIYGCTSKCTTYQSYNPTNNTCSNLCDISYNYYFDDVSAQACAHCPIGTQNDGNNVCIPLLPCTGNGRYIDYSNKCNYCPSGQIFNDANVCVVHCQDYETERNGRCEATCPIQYQQWVSGTGGGTGGGQCVDCPPGQITNEVNRCVPSTVQCRPGEMYSTAAPYGCVSQCKDYERWDNSVNGGNCIYKCDKNQRFSRETGSCIDCPFGQESDGQDGCVPITVTPKPTPNCPAGFDLCYNNFTQCDTICPYWRYNAEDDATNCEKICPLERQFYDKMTTDAQGHWIQGNNGCADCPTGYLVNDKNECTWCDESNGYSRRNASDNRSNVIIQGDPCLTECKEWEGWNAVAQTCDRYCHVDGTLPDNIQDDNEIFFDRTLGDCAWCPTGYLNNKATNECSICDTTNGYVSTNDPITGKLVCKNRCEEWQRWDNHAGKDRKGACVYRCEADDQLFDTIHESCRTCEDKHPNKFIFSIDKVTNTCKYTDNDPVAVTGTPKATPMGTPINEAF